MHFGGVKKMAHNVRHFSFSGSNITSCKRELGCPDVG
jgi:hypothetical protein